MRGKPAFNWRRAGAATEILHEMTLRKLAPRSPCLILLMGVAGTGKTTLAREIIRRIHAVYLDNNHIADAFFPNTRNSLAYRELRPGFYRALYAIAEANLRLGNSVLVDAPHTKEMQDREWRSYVKTLARETDSALVVLRCVCSEKVLQTRLRRRGELRDEWKLAHWDEFLKGEPIRVRIPFSHLNIDTENGSAKNVAAAVRYIRDRAVEAARG